MPVTPPPGPLRVTWNTRTEDPATRVLGLGGAEKVVVIGVEVPKPSSAFMATFGSPKLLALATGMLRVRSVVPDSSRLVGNGTTPLDGSNRAVMMPVTGEPSLLVAPGASTARGLLLPPPQAARNSDGRSAAAINRACIWIPFSWSFSAAILGRSNGRWQRPLNEKSPVTTACCAAPYAQEW